MMCAGLCTFYVDRGECSWLDALLSSAHLSSNRSPSRLGLSFAFILTFRMLHHCVLVAFLEIIPTRLLCMSLVRLIIIRMCRQSIVEHLK